MSGFNWRASKSRGKPTASIFAEPEHRCESELELMRACLDRLRERDKALAKSLIETATKRRLSSAQVRQVRRLAQQLSPKPKQARERKRRAALRRQTLKQADMAAYRARLTVPWRTDIDAGQGVDEVGG
jgi:chromosome segregation ATPase